MRYYAGHITTHYWGDFLWNTGHHTLKKDVKKFQIVF